MHTVSRRELADDLWGSIGCDGCQTTLKLKHVFESEIKDAMLNGMLHPHLWNLLETIFKEAWLLDSQEIEGIYLQRPVGFAAGGG